MTMIRGYQPGDHGMIAEIFTRAIHEIACRDYGPEQCEAWSGKIPNPEHWKLRCDSKQPFVFIRDGRIAGFLELDPDGHIDCTYVHPDHQRRGIASALIRHAIEVSLARGVTRLHVEASIGARPVFENLGFIVIEEQTVTIRGVDLVNYRMEYP